MVLLRFLFVRETGGYPVLFLDDPLFDFLGMAFFPLVGAEPALVVEAVDEVAGILDGDERLPQVIADPGLAVAGGTHVSSQQHSSTRGVV